MGRSGKAKGTFLAGWAIALALIASDASVAHAGEVSPPNAAEISTVVISSTEFPSASSTLTLTFDQPISDQEAAAITTDIGAGTAPLEVTGSVLRRKGDAVELTHSAEKSVTPMAAGPSGAYLDCNRAYAWSDVNGTFSLQRACFTGTAPWGYRLSPYIQGIVAGLVSELGLSWVRNGEPMSRMAPHTVPASYIFHGTFNPARAGDRIVYNDYFNFRHNLGQGGSAQIHIFGTFHLTNNKPCGSGGPC